MDFSINTSVSMLFDLIRVVILKYNDLTVSQIMNETVLSESDFIKDSIKNLWDNLDHEVPGVALFFTYDSDKGSYISSRYDKRLSELGKPDVLVNTFLEDSGGGILTDLLAYYSGTGRKPEHYKELAGDPEKLFTFISRLAISDRLKLELIEFSIDPDNILKPLGEFLHRVRRRIKREYTKHVDILKKSVKEFNVKLKQNPQRLMKQINRNLDTDYPADSGTYMVTVSLLNEHIVQEIQLDDTVLFILGCNADFVLKRGTHRDNVIETELFFKAFADQTRLRIIMFLARNDLYVGEIAKKCRLPLSTAAYHIDILVSAGIISGELKDKRVYYSINKEYVTKQFLFYNGLLYKG